MKRIWICSLLPILSLLGCGDAMVTSSVSPEVGATTGISTLSCLAPGPAPLLPSILQEGIFTDGRGKLQGRFELVSGPFLRTDGDVLFTCPQWQIGTQLTYTNLLGQDRVFWSSSTYGPLEGRVIFQEDPSETCPEPEGALILRARNDEQGRYTLLTRSCTPEPEPQRLLGRYFLGTGDPNDLNLNQ
ncbi:MAG: hypothetical protein HC921_20395 [Synechococcaceae cyanobacterium SM2_3_1]|nr:hypothetical protein [Synechococcaceae cyanobacterium SM2_3_1]